MKFLGRNPFPSIGTLPQNEVYFHEALWDVSVTANELRVITLRSWKKYTASVFIS